MVQVEIADFKELLELAEEAIIERASEYSNLPTEEDHQFFLRMWEVVSKPMPGYFRRVFKW
jgi:hypothetical protein